MKLKFSILITAIFIFSYAVQAQDFWMTKSYSRWTAEEVETMLNNSPWAFSREVRITNPQQITQAAGAVYPGYIGDSTTRTGGIDPATDIIITLRLRSANPVRQAIVKKNLFEKKQNLKSEEETIFEIRQKGLLACPACGEFYVLALTGRSKTDRNYDPIFRVFNSAQLKEIQTFLYLQNDKGEKRPLVNFVPPKAPGDEAIFFFPRLDEKGKPLFDETSKELIFNASKNEVNLLVNFKISIAPAMIDGKFDF